MNICMYLSYCMIHMHRHGSLSPERFSQTHNLTKRADSSDDESEMIDSSEDDGSGTMQQQVSACVTYNILNR